MTFHVNLSTRLCFLSHSASFSVMLIWMFCYCTCNCYLGSGLLPCLIKYDTQTWYLMSLSTLDQQHYGCCLVLVSFSLIFRSIIKYTTAMKRINSYHLVLDVTWVGSCYNLWYLLRGMIKISEILSILPNYINHQVCWSIESQDTFEKSIYVLYPMFSFMPLWYEHSVYTFC